MSVKNDLEARSRQASTTPGNSGAPSLAEIVPRDATIQALVAQVERLAGLLDAAGDRLGDKSHPDHGHYQGEWNEAARARALLSRLGVRP